MTLRYLSLFSGIEAASAARDSLGWQCAAVARYASLGNSGAKRGDGVR